MIINILNSHNLEAINIEKDNNSIAAAGIPPLSGVNKDKSLNKDKSGNNSENGNDGSQNETPTPGNNDS